MGQYDDARAERDFRLNPPDSAPGQGSDEWGSMLEGSSSLSDGSAFTGSGDIDINAILNGDNNNSNNTAPVNSTDLMKQLTSEEDKWLELAKNFIMGVGNFSKMLGTSIMNNTKEDWRLLGKRCCIVSFIAFIIGFVFLILKPIITSIKQPTDLMIGALLSGMVGVILLMFNSDENNDITEEIEEEEDLSEDINEDGSNGFFIEEDNTINDDDSEYDDSEDDEEEYDWGDFGDNLIFEDEDESEEISSGVSAEGFSIDDAINNIPTIPAGTWTRQYLFETYMSILPNIVPNFATMERITDATDEFMMYSEFLRSSAYQVGTKEENIPELEEIRKNLFIIQLRASRPTGLKEQEIADAVADLYKRDEDGNIREDRRDVYATVDSMVGTLVINIFTGNRAMVSLKDIYGQISDFVKNPEIAMPFVWGISELGKPYYCDLIKCDSLLISGEGRGGKSWKGQSIVAQLCMYNSPKEIEFYIFDTKDKSSDYRYLSRVLPHVKYFCGDGKKVNAGIKRLIDFTTKSTGKTLAEAEELNIRDYNRRHPDAKLPYRYVVIDEMMALMNSYEKEEQVEFRKLLSTIVSKYPYMGIRLILFPHRIIDSVIDKNTYSLISSRAVVRQLNEEEVKNAMGVTRKQFPYKLPTEGDMAIKSKEIANGETVFCHSEVLTSDKNDNEKVFKYIGSVWKKLVPEAECMELSPDSMVGGSIGNYTESVRKSDPVDHTRGISSYSYTDNIEDTSASAIEDVFNELGTDNSEEELDFWNDVLKNM